MHMRSIRTTPDVADPTNRPYLNGGIVLKFNANQKYCTDAVSAAMFRDICNQADVPVQTFTNRSDIAGGIHTWKHLQHTGCIKYRRYWTATAGYALTIRNSRCQRYRVPRTGCTGIFLLAKVYFSHTQQKYRFLIIIEKSVFYLQHARV